MKDLRVGLRPFPTVMVFDVERKRPACVLLQACLGGDMSVVKEFPSETWLVSPTPGMRRVEVESKEVLLKAIEVAVKATKQEKEMSNGKRKVENASDRRNGRERRKKPVRRGAARNPKKA